MSVASSGWRGGGGGPCRLRAHAGAGSWWHACQQVSATGFAALYVHGMPRGAAVLLLRRGADGAELRPDAVLRSPRMDVAVLRVPAGFLLPPPRAPEAPEADMTVWSVGAPRLGSPVARGLVEAPDAEMPGSGRGFTAWMPALLTGADVDVLARRDRRVFVLSIRRAEAEAPRLLG